MLQDGDLRLETCVDVLPVDGMQGVWGSNPHSSTQTSRSERCSRSRQIPWRSFDRHLTAVPGVD